MKKLEWKNDKPVVDTGCKTFDRYLNYIGTGNVWADGVFSNYLRPFNETECNKMEFPKGDLLKADLNHFKKYMSSQVRSQIEELMKEATESRILYMFFHRNHGKFTFHGFILTTGKYKEERFLRSWVTGPTYKSYNVLATMRDYICEPQEEKVEA